MVDGDGLGERFCAILQGGGEGDRLADGGGGVGRGEGDLSLALDGDGDDATRRCLM